MYKILPAKHSDKPKPKEKVSNKNAINEEANIPQFKQNQFTELEIQDAFNTFDLDKNGYISCI